MRVEGDEIVFSTERRLPAAAGIVGIDVKGDISSPTRILPDDQPEITPLTGIERRELAAEMILRWADYYGAVK